MPSAPSWPQCCALPRRRSSSFVRAPRARLRPASCSSRSARGRARSQASPVLSAPPPDKLAQLTANHPLAGAPARVDPGRPRRQASPAAQAALRGLDAARTRLAQLVAFETKAEGACSPQQLVSNYENDRPDLVSVVLEARGFQDLLEQISFATRIRKPERPRSSPRSSAPGGRWPPRPRGLEPSRSASRRSPSRFWPSATRSRGCG